ncbi:MAG: FkbM family methyltransferase [Parvibaculum sp.]|uniref:FkbM family methyltransferase n=1 Tax=Parvibaculum sp. TaxID=2024848 RepID=UPI00272443EE|nr:FkbM family methyltransferase [Parvibaculum sp.]MDO8837367.1 FkbM family methyltransferase [Parvibaculum sp.]
MGWRQGVSRSRGGSTLRALVKRIPGARFLARRARSVRSFIVNLCCRTYQSRLNSSYWRSHHFDALDAPFAISDHARENYVVRTSDKVIGKLLYCRGDFDLRKLERAVRIIEAERGSARIDIIYDIGANVGPICIPAIKRGYAARAVAFEPDPDNFRLLRINTLLNSVDDRIVCHQVALGAEIGEAKLIQNTENHGDHRIALCQETPVGDAVTVSVRRLDDFMPETAGVDCLLWIDVQGFEAEVLAGGTKALQAGWPLVLEFTPQDLKANGSFDRFLDLLTTSRYSKIFDLESPSTGSRPVSRAVLTELAADLGRRQTFTDILLL